MSLITITMIGELKSLLLCYVETMFDPKYEHSMVFHGQKVSLSLSMRMKPKQTTNYSHLH